MYLLQASCLDRWVSGSFVDIGVSWTFDIFVLFFLIHLLCQIMTSPITGLGYFRCCTIRRDGSAGNFGALVCRAGDNEGGICHGDEVGLARNLELEMVRPG